MTGARPPAPAPRGRSDRLWVAALLVVALALRLYGIQSGLPRVYEEAYPFKMAWTFWGFGPGRHVDFNPHWFKYPSLTLYLQWLGQALLFAILRIAGAARSLVDFRVLHELDPTGFYLMGRSITALLGAATVLPVFLAARRVAGSAAARAAALLIAISPALVEHSQVIEVDAPLTLFVACALLAAFAWSERPTRGRVAAAAVATGLAVTSKYPGLVLVVPCLVALAIAAPRGGGARAERPAAAPRTREPRRSGPRRASEPPRARPVRRRGAVIAWPEALVTYAIVLLVTVFVTSPFLFLDFRSAWADLTVEREHMATGHFGSDLGAAWITYARDWFTTVAGPTLALAALAGFARYAVLQRKAWALIAGSFVAAYAVLVSSVAMKADRYLLPLLPAAVVFAAALAAELAVRLARRGAPDAPPAAVVPDRGPSRTAAVRTAAIVVVLALPLAAGYPAHLARLRPDTRTAAAAWIEAHVPVGSFVACEQYGPPLTSPTSLEAVDRDLLPALRARGWEPKIYAVQSVPMFQVAPERSAMFYDPALYRIADAFVVTGAVRDRYRAEPARFAAQLALYDTLERRWARWQAFPGNGGPGPEIVIYRNPAQSTPFARRRPDPGPLPRLQGSTVSGGEAYYLCNLGLNYDLFGFVAAAYPAYVRGTAYSASEPGPAAACAERAALVLIRVGRRDEARKLLDQAAARSPRALEAARLREMRDRVPSIVR